VIGTHLLPLAVLTVMRVAREDRQRWHAALLLAATVGAQLWASLTAGMLTLAALGVGCVWLVVVRGRSSGRPLAIVVGGTALGVALALPVFLAYVHARDENPEYGHPDVEVLQNSATWSSYVFPPDGGGVLDEVYDDLADAVRPVYTPQEKTLFPGLVVSAAGLAAGAGSIVLLRRRSAGLREIGLMWLVAAAGLLLSFGPRYGGGDQGFPLPFAAVEAIVPGGLTRVPARFGALVLLGIVGAIGMVLARLRGRWRAGVAIALGVLLLVEAWPGRVRTVRVPTINAAHHRLASTSGRVLALPTLELTDAGALVFPSVPREAIHLWYSTAHFRPMVNGYGAFLPAPYVETASAVQDFPSAASIARLEALGVNTVVVEATIIAGTRWADVSTRLSSWPGAELIERDGATEVWDIRAAFTE
jgi:hypothetical protein